MDEVFFPTVFNGILGGGFKHLLFSTLPGEVNQFDEPIYFSIGLVQPPTRISLHSLKLR